MNTEKETATRRFRRLRQIWWLLRILEAAGALLLLSYSSYYVPAVARNSGEILHRASTVLISPSFVFLLGNAIVLVLFAKSGQIASSPESITTAFSGVDESIDICSDQSYSPPPPLREAEEVMYEDKAVCMEILPPPLSLPENIEITKEEAKLLRTEEVSCEARKAPEIEVKSVAAQVRVDGEGDEDAEQFRRTIEEFIARQQRFQRQESLTVIPYSAGLSEPVAV